MDHQTAIVGFIGVGGIARSHAYSLNSLKFYYNDIPGIELAAVCSANPSSREEEILVKKLAEKHSSVNIQIGFQYLYTAAIREALIFWRSVKS
jgi:predicted dehydrogenase